MKNVSFGFLFLALVLGVSAACCTTLWRLHNKAADAQRNAEIESLKPDASPDHQLSALSDLLEQNQDLERRLAALEMPPPRSARQAVDQFVTREEFDAFVAQLEERLEKRDRLSQGSAEFETHVAEALRAVREQQSAKQAEAVAKDRAAALEARVAKVTGWLSLDEYQQQEMRALLTVRDEEDQELMRLWKAGDTDPQVLGDMKSANRERHETALEQLLRPDQLETYRERGGKR